MTEIIIMLTFFRATYSFTNLGFLALAEFAVIHADRITGSLLFNTPPVLPADLKLQAKAVSDAHKAWEQNHGDDEYAALLAAEGELCGSLKKNAAYVTIKADGSKTLIESAGMVATKEKSPVVKPPFSAAPGKDKKTIKCFYNKEKEDEAVVWQCYPKSDSLPKINEVTQEGTTAKNHIIKELVSATYYLVFAAPIASKNAGKLNFVLVDIVLVP